ncbi:hypothetical protein CHH78_06610 [Shouchella clausii]|uniref:Uncharacterized protein n=1 Tax=Shouchella clausii TaxID=79880 RepID=A0A268S165_SHOCL|nr:hypothetical protein [Shouchella clausii]MBU8596169.1 hypothetical protein [Shouchella clausii]PAD09741.1 hypothetical protein CHH76_07385 [Shouchella clausii]PAE84747.1 hypothetical protein CHH78_06610 [Shouchella clausii]PAF05939.1 hypothetical protein CHH66_06605 [Shouchella clausii]PAF26230.1 hypothetical protein CHH61_09760 [Shouchella clausii]
MLELDKMIDKVNGLKEEHAKGIMKIICGKLDILKHADGQYTEEEFVKDVRSMIENFPQLNRGEENNR